MATQIVGSCANPRYRHRTSAPRSPVKLFIGTERRFLREIRHIDSRLLPELLEKNILSQGIKIAGRDRVDTDFRSHSCIIGRVIAVVSGDNHVVYATLRTEVCPD